jgi:hypothetical protein
LPYLSLANKDIKKAKSRQLCRPGVHEKHARPHELTRAYFPLLKAYNVKEQLRDFWKKESLERINGFQNTSDKISKIQTSKNSRGPPPLSCVTDRDFELLLSPSIL